MRFRAKDDVEEKLVDTLRGAPSDQATRQVYADWLEQHGYPTRATFLRADAFDDASPGAAPPDEASWRAITSRARIDRCTVQLAFECPKRWDALLPTEIDGVRHCAACQKRVFFCTSVEEARERGARHECIAIDASVARGTALQAYDTAARPLEIPVDGPPMVMGMVAPPPREPRPPIVVPPPLEKPSLLSRIGSWLARK